MAEPIVFDIRRELSSEALQALMRADRVIVSIKDQWTAALGCWWQDAEREPLSGHYQLALWLANRRLAHFPLLSFAVPRPRS